MKKTFTFFLFVVLVSSGCIGENADKTTQTKGALDALYGEVMSIHDEAMARMGELHRAKEKLTGIALETDSAAQKMDTLRILIDQIDAADEGMFDWMGEFRDPRGNSDDSTAWAYLKEELDKVRIVQIRIDEAIAASESAKPNEKQ